MSTWIPQLSGLCSGHFFFLFLPEPLFFNQSVCMWGVLHSRGSPTWQWQKGLAFGVKAFAASPLCRKLRAAWYFQQCSVRWKSKGQNPELWPAGPALLLALCRPGDPWPPAGMGKGRVHQLHPRNLVGCMDLKTRWLPRQKREEGTLLHFHDRICGCPAEGAFPWGPCAVQVWCFGTE